jgi:hypothetical protein
MGNRRFNFDLYVDELLTEGLSITDIQNQLIQSNINPAKYDPKHLLFLIALKNSNQGIEIYDELLQKITDKGLLNSLLSVCINNRRSNKPTIDLDKINRALQNPNDIRNIISNQKRQIENNDEPLIDFNELSSFLSQNKANDLFEILKKINPKIDNTLKQFINEYNQSDEEIKNYLKINAQRAKNLLELVGILHEAKTKSLDPTKTSTSLTVDDLRKESDLFDLEQKFYIIRTTYPDDTTKSFKLNLKYGQGNRFGLCISSKSNNYFLNYRIDDLLTTYFVYSLADPSLDENDINNYNILIIDAIYENKEDHNQNDDDYENDDDENNYKTFKRKYSYNPIAIIKNINPLKFEYSNKDIKVDYSSDILYESKLKSIFNKTIRLKSRDNKSFNLNYENFDYIFKCFPLSDHELKIKNIINSNENEQEIEEIFLSLSISDQIIILMSDNDFIKPSLFNKLPEETRDFFVKNIDYNYLKDSIFEQYNENEKLFYKEKIFKNINKEIEKTIKKLEFNYENNILNSYTNIDKDVYEKIFISSKVLQEINLGVRDIDFIKENPELYKKIIEPQKTHAVIIRDEIMQHVDGSGVFRGDLNLYYSYSNYSYLKERELILKYFLPDLSDIIIEGYFSIAGLKISSLKGCPKIINKEFRASGNLLKTLEGGPEIVNGSYDVSSNLLQSIEHCAPMVNGKLNVSFNKQLMSLEGCPENIFDIDASYCNLQSLKGCPKILYNLNVEENNLTSFEYGPEMVDLYFEFKDNPISSIKGYPKYVRQTDGYQLKLSKQAEENIKRELNIDGDLFFDNKLILKKLKNEQNLSQDEYQEEARKILKDKTEKIIKHINTKKEDFMRNYNKKSVVYNRESVVYNLMKSFLLTS